MAHLTRDQAKAVANRLRSTIAYMTRLRERMEKVGFARSDPLYYHVAEADEAMRAVGVLLHYASCASGVGEPATPPREANPGTAPG